MAASTAQAAFTQNACPINEVSPKPFEQMTLAERLEVGVDIICEVILALAPGRQRAEVLTLVDDHIAAAITGNLLAAASAASAATIVAASVIGSPTH